MDKSYFAYMPTARNKIKSKFNKIKACEKRIKKIQEGKYNNNSSFDKPYNNQAIAFLKEIIEENKEKINKISNIYLHG